MGVRNQTTGERRRKSVRVPVDACYYCSAPMRGDDQKWHYWIAPVPGYQDYEWWVPEFLIDRRGHNTNVCHAKYKSSELPVTVTGNATLKNGICHPSGVVLVDSVTSYAWAACVKFTAEEGYVSMEYQWTYTADVGRKRQRWNGISSVTIWETRSDGRPTRISECHDNSLTWYVQEGDEDFPHTVEQARSYAKRNLREISWTGPSANAKSVSWVTNIRVEVPDLSNPAYAFRLNEPEYERGRAELPELVRPAMEEAYKTAAREFPKMADNNIANAIEAGSTIVDALRGNVSGIPKDLASLWMWYRYTFSTTQSDVKQGISAFARIQAGVEQGREYHGSVSAHIGEVDARVRWSGWIGLNTDDMLRLTQHRLWSAGIEPSAYIGWDLLPFSFVVDWFCDIGGKLEEEQEDEHLFRDYIINDSCYSIAYEVRSGEAPPVECYYRFYHPPVQSHGELFLSTPGKASCLTWSKRAADFAVLGRPIGGKVQSGLSAAIRVLR